MIRDKRYKVWINTERKIEALYDLKFDPWEKHNLIGSGKSEHLSALRKCQAVLDKLPAKDARPRYTPRPPNPWDKKRKAKGTKRKTRR